eukprot:PhF_6_TR4262/c0_g1_i1/m.5762
MLRLFTRSSPLAGTRFSAAAASSSHFSLFSGTISNYSTTSESSSNTTTSSQPPSAPNSPSLDVAMGVNKLKRQHQSLSAGPERKKVEMTAWQNLNSLTEEQIMVAEGKAVALLLNSWAYFSKHWERGKDGPEGTGAPNSQAGQQK